MNYLSTVRRRYAAVVMPLLILALLVGACGPSTAPTGAASTQSSGVAASDATVAPGVPIERETLIVGVQGLPGTMEPSRELSNVGSRVTYSVFDMLIRRDFLDNNKLVPSLATEWERTSDTVLRLKLREGVTFHNGEAFTADDVKFTFERMMDPDSPLSEARTYYASFKEIRVIDDYTVEIETFIPDPLLENRLATWGAWIVPKDYYEEVGGTVEAFGAAAVGAGPYRVVSLNPDKELILERYDGYWGDLPPVKQVIFRVIPESSTRVIALINGEVDIITNIPPDQIPTMQAADNVVLKQIPLANMHVLRYNTNHPVLADKRLRQAMNLAIDRQLLIDTLWGGKAVPLRSHQFEEYGPLYNPDRPLTPYDPERARELVEASDYDGSVITYLTQADYYTNGLQAGQAIIEMWRAVGINAEIRLRQPGESIPNEEVMVANWSNSSILADPDGALWRGWGANSATQRNYWNAPEEFNLLGEEARSTLDIEVRYDNYQRMLDIWEEEAPGTVLYIPVENYGLRQGVNWEPYPFYYMDLRAYNLSFSE